MIFSAEKEEIPISLRVLLLVCFFGFVFWISAWIIWTVIGMITEPGIEHLLSMGVMVVVLGWVFWALAWMGRRLGILQKEEP